MVSDTMSVFRLCGVCLILCVSSGCVGVCLILGVSSSCVGCV